MESFETGGNRILATIQLSVTKTRLLSLLMQSIHWVGLIILTVWSMRGLDGGVNKEDGNVMVDGRPFVVG